MTTAIQNRPVASPTIEPARLEAMGPTEILSYASAASQQIDEQVRRSINGMQASREGAAHLSHLRQGIGAIAEKLQADGKGQNDKVDITKLGLDIAPEVMALLPTNEDGEVKVSLSTLDRIDTDLQLQQNQLSSDQQTQLMAVQEAMRQRSELIQLLSNILREHSQTDLAIVRNMQ